MVIGVDTGNRCIKTRYHTYVSGVTEVSTNAPSAQEELIWLHQGSGKTSKHVLLPERSGYLLEKDTSEEYFVLTLFAIAKELETRNIIPVNVIDVKLAVGLPPRDYVRMKPRYLTYFGRGYQKIRYHGKTYTINISKVFVFPQGGAAIFALPEDQLEALKRSPSTYIVDIGGYTTDVMHLNFGIADYANIISLDYGMIHIYNDAQQAIQAATGKLPSEAQIDYMLRNNCEISPAIPMLPIVQQTAREFTKRLIQKLNETKIDLSLSTPVFMGGGSIALRRDLEEEIGGQPAIFVTSINANAIGFENMAEAVLAKAGVANA